MFTKRTRISLLIATIFLLSSGGAMVVCYHVITQLGSKLDTQVQAVADSSAQANKYAELSALMQKTRPDRMALHDYILNEDQIIEFLTDLEALGREQGLQLAIDELQVIEEPGDFNNLQIKGSFSGRYNSALNYLSLLETYPMRTVVTDFSFVADTTTDSLPETVTGSFTLLVAVYSYDK